MIVNYLESLIILSAILSLLTMGLNVRWGWAGEFDLAYYAIVAFGAYFGGVLQLPHSHEPTGLGWILGLNLPFVVGLLGGAVIGGVTSLLVGAFALKSLRGDYLSIATVAFALVTWAFLSQLPGLFNGFNGVYGMQQPFADVFKNLDAQTYALILFAVCVVILVIVYVFLEMMYKSPFGRTLRAIREDEFASAAFGRDVYRCKLKAYIIGGVVAGIGGVLFANYLGQWNPYTWAPIETFLLYGAIFIGGQGNSRGVIIGSVILLVLIPEVTRFMPQVPGKPDLFPALRSMASAVLVILVLRYRPQGLLPEVHPRDAGDRAPAPTAQTAGSAANV